MLLATSSAASMSGLICSKTSQRWAESDTASNNWSSCESISVALKDSAEASDARGTFRLQRSASGASCFLLVMRNRSRSGTLLERTLSRCLALHHDHDQGKVDHSVRRWLNPRSCDFSTFPPVRTSEPCCRPQSLVVPQTNFAPSPEGLVLGLPSHLSKIMKTLTCSLTCRLEEEPLRAECQERPRNGGLVSTRLELVLFQCSYQLRRDFKRATLRLSSNFSCAAT